MQLSSGLWPLSLHALKRSEWVKTRRTRIAVTDEDGPILRSNTRPNLDASYVVIVPTQGAELGDQPRGIKLEGPEAIAPVPR